MTAEPVPDERWRQDLQATRLAALGGALALDFVNTVEYRGRPQVLDVLTTPPRLLAWCVHAGLLQEAEALRMQAERAAKLFRRGVALRETLHRLFGGIVEGRPPQGRALDALNTELATTASARRLESAHGVPQWAWSRGDDPAPAVIGTLALDAADLLTSERLARLRRCPSCAWLFVDSSRNGLRRWCSMDFCGGRMKSRRQYERRRAPKAQPLK